MKSQMNVIFKFQDVVEIVDGGMQTLEANVNDTQRAAHIEHKNKDGKNSHLDSLICGSKHFLEDH